MKTLDVAIVGAGPNGIACALEAREAELSFLLIEQEKIVASLHHFPRGMQFLSPSKRLEICGRRLMSRWFSPCLTEVIEYYTELAAEISDRVLCPCRINKISRPEAKFILEGSNGTLIESNNVIFSTGYFSIPNKLEVPGENLPHVKKYYDAAVEVSNQQILVIGAQNSAAECATALEGKGATVTLCVRGSKFNAPLKPWYQNELLRLQKAGRLTILFNTMVAQITNEFVVLRREGKREEMRIPAEQIYAMIGYCPDLAPFEGMPLEFDEATKRLNCDTETQQSSFPGLYFVGAMVDGCHGRKTFIQQGREQARNAIRSIKNSFAFDHKVSYAGASPVVRL